MASSHFTILVVLLLGLAAQASARKRSHDHESHRGHGSHWKRPKWCGDKDCPEFCVEKEYDEYEIRTYRTARWVVTDESDEKYEIAFLRGSARLRLYMDGKNDDHELLRHTTPVVSELRPNKDSTTTQKNYTFAMYLPDRYQGRHGHRIPKPLDPSVRVEKWEKDTLFVHEFGGFATEATILNQMNELADVLDEDRRDYEDERVWVAVYHPPTRLWERHNELLMEVSPRKKRCGEKAIN